MRTGDRLRTVLAVRRRLPLLSWIALLAMAALALLPSISHALARAQGSSPYVEVCTTQGARLVALADDGGATTVEPGAGGMAGAAQLQHCPLCSLSSDMPALPVPDTAPALPLAAARPPALFFQAPYTLHAWCSAQPRGPPAIS